MSSRSENSSSGLTSFDFFRFCLANASASALRLASSASVTAPNRSISSSFDAFVTVSMSCSLSAARQAGLQRLCLPDNHRKSRINRFSFPGDNLVPRPTIWQYSDRIFVGLSTTTQSHDGQSHPSVNSIALQSTAPGPALSNQSRISFLSVLVPLTSFAPGIIPVSSCAMLISGQNTTVFLADASRIIDSAI